MTPEEKDELAACRRSEDEVALVERLILAERERCAKVDFIRIIWGVLKKHKKDQRLALHDLHQMAIELAAAIRKEPTDDTD